VSRSITSLKYAAVGAVIAGSLALAGCGAGQITQTSSQVSNVDGGSGTIGQIAVRDATIPFGSGASAAVYPQGGSAPLQMTIANFGGADDKLVSASSPAADSVQITGNATIAAGRALIVSGGPSTRQGAGAASGTPASGTPASNTPASGAPATGSASASATPARPGPTTGAVPAPIVPTASVTVPPPDAQGSTKASIVLNGLTKDIQAGLTYPVQLTFAKAGTVTVEVPVANPNSPLTTAAG
jgi:copper(I)-binding protein